MDDPTQYRDRSLEGGFNGLLGFRIAEWKPDYAVLELTVEPKHLNRTGVLHGGVLAALIDATCGYSGCYCTIPGNARFAVTLSLTTSFLGGVSAGIVRCVARKRGGGRRVFAATAEVFNDNGELIAVGESSYQYRKGSDEPQGLPG
jgi:uncharacterized protein (TIGR00369 family)